MTYDPEKPLWSLMTKSRNGNVSIIKGLTLREAAKAYERLNRDYGRSYVYLKVHDAFKHLPIKGTEYQRYIEHSRYMGRTYGDGDIDLKHVFGPEGWEDFGPDDLETWPKEIIIFTDNEGEILPDEYQLPENIETANFHRAWKKNYEATLKETKDYTISVEVKEESKKKSWW